MRACTAVAVLCLALGSCSCGETTTDQDGGGRDAVVASDAARVDRGQADALEGEPCGDEVCGPGTFCCGPPECGFCAPENSGVYCPETCPDASVAADSAVPADGATVADSSAASDAGAPLDAVELIDSASPVDASAVVDAAGVPDGSAPADVAALSDATASSDGTALSDASTTPDSATPSDAGVTDTSVADTTPIPDSAVEDTFDAYVSPCAIDNGGCDWRTTCTVVDAGVSCGPCPTDYTGDGETGCVALGWDLLPPIVTELAGTPANYGFDFGREPVSGTWYHIFSDSVSSAGYVVVHAIQDGQSSWTDVSAEPRASYGNNFPAYVPAVSPTGVPQYWVSSWAMGSVYGYSPASGTWSYLGAPPDQYYDPIRRLSFVFYPDGQPALIYDQDYQLREGIFSGGVFTRGHFTATGTLPFYWESAYDDSLLARVDALGQLHLVHRYPDAEDNPVRDLYIFKQGQTTVGPVRLPPGCGRSFAGFTADSELLSVADLDPLTLCWRDDQGAWQQQQTDKARPGGSYWVSTLAADGIILLEQKTSTTYELWFLDTATWVWYASPYLLDTGSVSAGLRGFKGSGDGSIAAGYQVSGQIPRVSVYRGPQLEELMQQ